MTDKDRHIAALMCHDIVRLLASTRPTLLSYGYPEQTVDSWIEKAEDELRNTRKKMYVRVSNYLSCLILPFRLAEGSYGQWICTWAIKPGVPGESPEE